MARIRWYLSHGVCAIALWLTACSPAKTPGPSIEGEETERVFSRAEREAASALALGADAAAADQVSDPFERAIQCQSALSSVRERLASSNGVSDQHLAAFTEADQLFARLVRETGQDAGRSPAEINRAVRSARSTATATAEEARTALGCLQQLQRTGGLQQG